MLHPFDLLPIYVRATPVNWRLTYALVTPCLSRHGGIQLIKTQFAELCMVEFIMSDEIAGI